MLTTLAALGPIAHVGGPYGGFGLAFLLIPLFWILVVVLIFAIVGRRWRHKAFSNGYGPGYGPGFGHHGPWGAAAARNAESTLAERFAQGDIDEKEYRARLEVLRANAFPPRPPKA